MNSLLNRSLSILHDGRWSNNNFEVTSWGAHAAETKLAEWTDVSEFVVNDVYNVRYWLETFDGDLECLRWKPWLRYEVNEDRERFRYRGCCEKPLMGV